MSRAGSLGTATLALFLSCAPAAPTPLRPEPVGGVSRCGLGGIAEFGAGEAVYQDAQSKLEIARFPGGRVALAVDMIEAGARAHVVAKVPPEGPSLAIAGWIDTRDLDTYAIRDLPIAARSIYIPIGARVRVRSARGGALRVSPRDTDFPDLTADASCFDLTLTPPKPGPKAAPRRQPHHLAREVARFFERPHGAVLVDVRPSREKPTFEIDGFKRGLKHVRYEQGVVIDAWVNAEDLEVGEGPGCDHCYGGGGPIDVEDRCGPEESDGFDQKNCPGPGTPRARATRDATVARTPGGPSIGVLENGAEVYIVKKSEGWVRVSPTKAWFRPPAGSGFWVEATALAE